MNESHLYDDLGWVDFYSILASKLPFIFMVGARGIGKTYGAFDALIKLKIKFLYLRRTQKQLDFINNKSCANVPCKPVLSNMGMFEDFDLDTSEDIGIYRLNGEPFCITAALSTIANIRGFDGSDIDVIVYDEFIPEGHQQPIKDEGAALMNCYETINRNRELEGRPPVKLICMANSNKGDNAIFNYLKLVRPYTKLQKQNKIIYESPQRGLAIIRYDASPISDQKQNTALYKLTKGTDFWNMALHNRAKDVDEFIETRVNIKEFYPVVEVGELMIYKHKSEFKWYVTNFKSGTPRYSYSADQKGIAQFRHECYVLSEKFNRKQVKFGEYDHETLFKEYLNIK